MKRSNFTIQGIPVSSGYVIAPVYLMRRHDLKVTRKTVAQHQLARELERFQIALQKAREDISIIHKQVQEQIGAQSAAIFNVHILILEDPTLLEQVEERINAELCNIEYAFFQVLQDYIKQFQSIDDAYIRERLADIQDVGRRILNHLTGDQEELWRPFEENMIIVADDLLPSDTALMYKDNIIGFVTNSGSRTSHTAIMARSLEVPAIVGTRIATEKIQSGDLLILDAVEGLVIVNPDEKTLKVYQNKIKDFQKFSKELTKLKDLDAVTQDGREVSLQANIELPDDVHAALRHGAQGIGLFRTEFLYMNRYNLPEEEEHFEIYKNVVNALSPHPVVVRTLDVGGDKLVQQLNVVREENPALGFRGIRFCLKSQSVFKTQLRALLRAGFYGNLKIMFPMIAGLEELRATKALLKEVMQDLKNEGVEFNEDIPIGIMIETPSAAITADLLAQEVDFFSIGTNDLIQYTLAVDRGNEKVASYYDPMHPAILRMIHTIVEAGHNAGIPVAMCGEMSSESSSIELLIGLGLDSLSVSHSVIPGVKRVIRAVSYEDAQGFAKEALQFKLGCKLRDLANKRLEKILLISKE
jgi:phosphotransferase system enzyme I (PtsI)